MKKECFETLTEDKRRCILSIDGDDAAATDQQAAVHTTPPFARLGGGSSRRQIHGARRIVT